MSVFGFWSKFGGYRFTLTGYVIMPEHVHLLVSEPERKSLSVVMQVLQQSVARNLNRRVAALERHGQQRLWQAERPFWQKRYYDFNAWSAFKEREKLRYIHRNPVKRGLVTSPEQWKWSSFRFYAYRETGVVKVNELFSPTLRKPRRVGHPSPQLD